MTTNNEPHYRRKPEKKKREAQSIRNLMELDLSGSISSESAPAFWILNRSLTHRLIEIGTADIYPQTKMEQASLGIEREEAREERLFCSNT